MEPLLHIISRHRLFITALSHRGKVMKILHQARVSLNGEHDSSSLALSIGHIPLFGRRRFERSFRQHTLFIAHPFTLCRGSLLTSRAQ